MTENPLSTCGYRKFQLDPLGEHLNTCTTHSGSKKTHGLAHDWTVDQLADLFRTTHKVKTQQVIYLANVSGPVPLVLDLRITQTVSEVPLTLVLMDIYVILMI